MTDKKRDTAIGLLLGVFLIFFSYGNYWSAHWYAKWAVLCVYFVAFFSYWIAKRTSYVFLPALLVAGVNGVYMFAWNNVYRTSLDMVTFISLKEAAFYTYFAIIMSCFTLIALKTRHRGAVIKFLAMTCLLSIGYTLYKWNAPFRQRGAFSGNPSMNGCLIACLLPFALLVKKRWLQRVILILAVAAVFRTESSVPIGTLCVVLLTYSIAYTKLNVSIFRKALWVALPAILLGGAYYAQGAVVFNSSGRFEIWMQVMQWWIDHSSLAFGAGLGSTMYLVPMIQKWNGEMFIWLHNDWLQVLFELGIVGFISIILAWVYLAVKAWKQPVLFASLMGFSAMAMLNYPSHLPIHALSMVLLVWLILNRKEVKS